MVWATDHKEAVALLESYALSREHPRLGVHLSHCNFGEQPNACKYGDDDCPALTEGWSWFGKALQRADRRQVEADQREQRVRELIAKWRANAETFGRHNGSYSACADQLEVALERVVDKKWVRRYQRIPFRYATEDITEMKVASLSRK
jgi:hypothetical protein